jgi:hypothetical protein
MKVMMTVKNKYLRLVNRSTRTHRGASSRKTDGVIVIRRALPKLVVRGERMGVRTDDVAHPD